MKVIRIPKGNGKFRVVYAPDEERKKLCRSFSKYIQDLAALADVYDVQHGFTVGRSPVTNAMQHIGYSVTLSFDLKDFFDTVMQDHLIGSGASLDQIADWAAWCFYDGAARQGLPSSPAIANLAAAPMDSEIMQMQDGGRFGPLFVYTRYADDLTFSFDLHWIEDVLRKNVPVIVERHGFRINPEKTHLQKAAAGRRIITGVAVDHQGIHPTRAVKRRLRAGRHQLDAGHGGRRSNYRGLLEWSKLVVPRYYSKAPGTYQMPTLKTIAAASGDGSPPDTTELYERKFNP